jgi:hypothetical protein
MADDYTDNISTRGILYPGAQATGVLEAANDSDWFKITLSAGKYYTFDLSAAAGSYQSLYFYNASGAYIGSSWSGSGSASYTVKAGSSSTYYVGVRDQSSSSNRGEVSYTLKASAGVTDAIGDNRDAATALAFGQVSSSVLESGDDIDYFKITAQAGVTYAVTASGNLNGSGSGFSGNVRIEAPDGNYIGSYGSSGASFTATRTGDYYLAVSSSYSSGFSYTIGVTKPVDDHSASTSGAGQLAVGMAATTGRFEVGGDVDWYGVELAADTTYWFTLGTAGSGSYSGYGALKLIAGDGTVVATAPGNYVDGNGSMLLQYVPTTAGKYYLEVSGTSSYGAGNYAVRAVVGEADDYGNTQATAALLTPGAAIDGKLAIAQDVDMFRLSAAAGKTYLVALTVRGLDGASELQLSGQSAGYANGDPVEYGKAGVAEYRVLTANTAGDYYFTVSPGYGRGTGSYALAVTEAPADDHAAGRSTASVLAVGSKASGVLDYTGDIDTFKVTLQYGAKYAFQLRGAGSGEGTLSIGTNVQLQISGPDQNSYVSLTDNRDGTYSLATTTGGDYYLSVRPQNYYYGSTPPELTGSYTLHAVALNADTAAPKLLSHAPAANAGPLDDITLRFSEAIMRGSGGGNEAITLRDSLGVTIETYYRDDSRVTINGDTLTINPSVQLKPGSKYLLSLPSGAVMDLAGNKFAGSELLAIDTVGTVSTGGAGNDYLIGLGNGAKLSGAGGVDTAIYGYDRSNYDVVRAATGTSVTKTSWDGTGTPDVLDGVERLMFANVSVALDIDGVAGQAYRLYRAAFDRAPDKAGIGYWIGQMDDGLSLQQVARGFLNSSEFATLYGASPTDSVFVNKLYQNILHRAADAAGIDYWLGVLSGGADRANVLVAFSEGAENQAAALQVIGNGFEYTPYG